MQKAKWWSIEELWVGLLIVFAGLVMLGLSVWKAPELGDSFQVGGVLFGCLIIISLGAMFLIGFFINDRSLDDEDEPVAQRPQQEARV